MREPRTPKEYLDLVDQTIFEIRDLLACADEEGDGDYQLSELLPVYEQLEAEHTKLHASIAGGTHTGFGTGSDISFMPQASEWKRAIPFYDLLETLNKIHRDGLAGTN
ncbi:MAG: hypothetical protein ACE5H7_10915 [Acidiferrobacterales bacterium]